MLFHAMESVEWMREVQLVHADIIFNKHGKWKKCFNTKQICVV